MKTVKYLLLAGLLFAVFTQSKSQNTLLLFTKTPMLVNVSDETNVNVPKKPIWSNNDGGYVLNYNNMYKTFLSSKESIQVKLSDKDKTTKSIALQANQKVSLYKCMNSDQFCCDKLSEKQKKGTKKLYAVAVMKKAIERQRSVIFPESNPHGFLAPEDFSLTWSCENNIEEIYLVDVNSTETIWAEGAIDGSVLTYEMIKDNLDKPLQAGHRYILNIVTDKTDDTSVTNKKHVFEFDIQPFVYITNAYYFPTKQALNIEWNTNLDVSGIQLTADEELLWETDEFTASALTASSIDNINLEPEKSYTLTVKTENGDYEYYFEILLNEEESSELKNLVE